MKLIRNDLYDQYTKTTIGFDTDFSEITKEQLHDTFKFHCANMRVLSEVVDYIYEAIHKDNIYKDRWKGLGEYIDNAVYNSWYLYKCNTVQQYEDGIRANTYESVREKMYELEEKGNE